MKKLTNQILAIGLLFAAVMNHAQELERRGANNKCGYVIKGSKSGLMGPKFVIKDHYTCSSKEFDDEINLAVVQSVSNNKWGVINKKGDVVIPMEYQEGTTISNGKIVAKKDGKWGLLDTAGKTLLPFEYDYLNAESTNKTKVLLARKGDNPKQYGFIDYSGNILVPIEYELIKFVPMSISNGSRHFNMKKDGKFGLYGLDEGKFLTDIKYDAEIWFTSTKLPLVYKGKIDGDEYEISETGTEKYLGAGTPKSSSTTSSSSTSSTAKKSDAKKTEPAKKEEIKKQTRYACTRCGTAGISENNAPPTKDLSGVRACKTSTSSYTSHAWKKQ